MMQGDDDAGIPATAAHRHDQVVADDRRHAGLAGQALEPARHIHGIAEHGVFKPARVADIADQHLAVMHADADRDRHLAALGSPRRTQE